jgi:medium-chain acyl-[acyl-carrier-protein] hydrolase
MRTPADSIADLWIDRTRGNGIPRFRLFCFPYAGGGAGIYRDWAKDLGLQVEVCAIRLPGRERRYAEAPLRRAEQVVAALAPILRHYLDLPFVMFGHSMGAVLAYEVARALRTDAGAEPRALFVSAHPAPQSRLRHRDWHALPRDALIAELKALNGTPAEVFEHDDLVDLMLPMLRGDLELIETYRGEAAPPLLSCPVVAMGGAEDRDVPPEDLAGWASVTEGPFKSLRFQGGHFFINSGRTGFMRALHHELGLVGLG